MQKLHQFLLFFTRLLLIHCQFMLTTWPIVVHISDTDQYYTNLVDKCERIFSFTSYEKVSKCNCSQVYTLFTLLAMRNCVNYIEFVRHRHKSNDDQSSEIKKSQHEITCSLPVSICNQNLRLLCTWHSLSSSNRYTTAK